MLICGDLSGSHPVWHWVSDAYGSEYPLRIEKKNPSFAIITMNRPKNYFFSLEVVISLSFSYIRIFLKIYPSPDSPPPFFHYSRNNKVCVTSVKYREKLRMMCFKQIVSLKLESVIEIFRFAWINSLFPVSTGRKISKISMSPGILDFYGKQKIFCY